MWFSLVTRQNMSRHLVTSSENLIASAQSLPGFPQTPVTFRATHLQFFLDAIHLCSKQLHLTLHVFIMCFKLIIFNQHLFLLFGFLCQHTDHLKPYKQAIFTPHRY